MVEAIRTGKRAKAALAVASLVGLGGSAAHASTIGFASVNFNGGATDLSGNFNQETNGVASSAFSWGATAGVMDQAGPSAGGGVTGAATDDTLIYNGGTIDFTTGQTYTLSVMYQRGNTTAANKIQLGVVDASNRSFNGGSNDTGYNFISARILGGTKDLIQGQFDSNVASAFSNATTLANGPSFSYIVGHWYQLNVNIAETNTSTGTFKVDANVVDFGTAGTTAGAVVNEYSAQTVTDSNLINNNALWAGFRDSGEGTATAAANYLSTGYDNFAVPEPTSIALVALGGLAGLSRRRRRV